MVVGKVFWGEKYVFVMLNLELFAYCLNKGFGFKPQYKKTRNHVMN